MAQDEKKAVPLRTVLDQISRQHNIRFSYIDDEIIVYKVVPPVTTLPLKEKILYLESETKLRFTAATDKYFTIFNDKRLDKPLCGHLLDAETGTPIENASLVIPGTNAATSTDAKGYFELPKISPANIVIRHLGYLPFEISPEVLYASGCPEIKLIPVTFGLSEVVTRRFLTTGISKNTDGTFRVKPLKFGILPGLTEPDVLQTMQQLPGIYSENETISNISVRGGTHDQNLFLWNGIRMFQTGHFFGLISAFNPLLPHTISIAKNGTSAFFGESVSSLVEISSRGTDDDPNKNVLSADMISGGLSSTVRISPTASIAVSGRHSFTDFANSPTYQKYRNRIFQNTVITDVANNDIVGYSADEDFSFYDFSAQYQQKINRHEFDLNVIGMKNSLEVRQRSENEVKASGLSQQSYGASAGWKSQWNDRQITTAGFFVSPYTLDSDSETPGQAQKLEQRNEVLAIGADIKHSVKIDDKLDLSAGYQYSETGITNSDKINSPSFSREITEVLRSHAVVGEMTLNTVDRKTFLKLGFRATYFEKFRKFRLEPRLQFNHAINQKLRLEVLGEMKSQTISQVIDHQQDFLGIEKRRWKLANDNDVPVQQSAQISAGLTFKSEGWLLSVENFYKAVTGITTSGQNFQDQLEFVRATGRYNVIGSEMLVQKNFGRFYAWLGYGFSDNKYSFDSITPKRFRSNFELAHVVSCAGIYEWNKLKIALGSKWHTGRPFTTPSEIGPDSNGNPQIEYNRPNGGRLTEFFQVDFSASKEWQIRRKMRLQAGLSVANLLNRKNVINRYYRLNDDRIERVDTYALERTPNLNIKLTF